MKKTYKVIFLICLLSLIFGPVLVQADGLVPCDGVTKKCTIGCLFVMLGNIYNFIVTKIAGPLAVIALVVGAIFMLVSAGNPTIFAKGKTIMFAAIIGLVLAVGSYAIINFILSNLLGYTGGGGQNYSC